MKWYRLCGIVLVFLLQIYSVVLGILFVYRNVPYESIFCETYDIIINDYPCIMDNGFLCKTPNNFLIDLKVKCDNTIYTVYQSETSYCECCDITYSKYCMVHWISNSWYPFTPNQFPFLVTHYQANQTKYFRQNGIVYLSENPKNSLFLACLICLDLLLFVGVAGVLQFVIYRSERIRNVERIELV